MPELLKQQRELTELLKQHCRAYYRDDSPELTDVEYDGLFLKLKAMEAASGQILPGSPTQTIGGECLECFQELRHSTPMLSLDNVFNAQELQTWITGVVKANGGDCTYVVEPKLDGLALRLVYRKGVLESAATRGDGTTGENVTANAKTIWNLPQQLDTANPPEVYEIAGEVVISRSRMQALNAERAERNEKPFATCRNAAAGSLRQLDSKVTAGRGLAFYAYQVIDGTDTQEHLDAMEEAKTYGFEVALDVVQVPLRDRLSCADLEDLLAHWDEARKDSPYDTDGLVFKINHKPTQEALGYTGRVPRWAIAYKFPPKTVITPLISVDFQVGRTGAVTPVANLQPVVIDGVFVSRATIHNADELLRLGLCYDDHVVVHRAGEVIPQILRAFKPKYEGPARPRGEPVVFPVNCPECGTPLERIAGEAETYCPNGSGCPAQQLTLLEHFASRKAMDLQGFGGRTIEILYSEGLLETPVDFFSLFENPETEEEIAALPGFGRKSIETLKASIYSAQVKKTELGRLLFGLGIHGVGYSTSRDFANWLMANDLYEHLFVLNGFTAEQLMTIKDIGPVTALSIVNYLSRPDNVAQLQRLRGYLSISIVKAEVQPLVGKTIVVTGSFPQVDRDTLVAYLTSLGAKVSGSVSTKTSYVVAGNEAGKKLSTAIALGVPVLQGDELHKQSWWTF